MPLPKIEHPLFEVTIPSTGQQIKMRPFLVKEEKILLGAVAGQEATATDPTQLASVYRNVQLAIKQVLTNCIVQPTVDIDKLLAFDVEYLFLRLREQRW